MSEEEREFIQLCEEKYKTEFLNDDEVRIIFEIIESLETKLDKEKEKNKGLEIRANELNNLGEIVQRDYIHKDKIKEKIEKYKELVNDFEEYWSKDPRKFTKEKCTDYYKIEVLEELLKGE